MRSQLLHVHVIADRQPMAGRLTIQSTEVYVDFRLNVSRDSVKLIPTLRLVNATVHVLTEPTTHSTDRLSSFTTNLLYAAGDVYSIQRLLHLIQFLSYIRELKGKAGGGGGEGSK